MNNRIYEKMGSDINNFRNLFKGNILDKFVKINLNSEQYCTNDLENLAFKIALSGCRIINTEYNSTKLNSIRKGLKTANEKSKEFKLEISKPLISINFELNNNIEQLIKRIKFLYSEKINFDILNIIFGERNDYFIEEFLIELSKIENTLIYTINLNRNKLSNSSILKITNSFYQKISKNLIIEIDYISLRDNDEDLNSDLQILSTADIIFKDLIRENKKYKRIPIVLPIRKLSSIQNVASQCSIKYDGISLKDFTFLISDIEIFDKNKISNNLMEKISNEAIDNINKFLEINLSYPVVTDK